MDDTGLPAFRRSSVPRTLALIATSILCLGGGAWLAASLHGGLRLVVLALGFLGYVLVAALAVDAMEIPETTEGARPGRSRRA